jgi:hypothetical protein
LPASVASVGTRAYTNRTSRFPETPATPTQTLSALRIEGVVALSHARTMFASESGQEDAAGKVLRRVAGKMRGVLKGETERGAGFVRAASLLRKAEGEAEVLEMLVANGGADVVHQAERWAGVGGREGKEGREGGGGGKAASPVEGGSGAKKEKMVVGAYVCAGERARVWGPRAKGLHGRPP